MPRRASVQWRTETGQPVTVGGVTVTPVAHALVARLPGGAVVWNRPVALVIEPDGRRQRVPLLDSTRLAQAALLGLGLLAVLIGVVAGTRRKERSR